MTEHYTVLAPNLHRCSNRTPSFEYPAIASSQLVRNSWRFGTAKRKVSARRSTTRPNCICGGVPFRDPVKRQTIVSSQMSKPAAPARPLFHPPRFTDRIFEADAIFQAFCDCPRNLRSKSPPDDIFRPAFCRG